MDQTHPQIEQIIFHFFISLAISIAIMPLLRKASIRVGWIAQPRKDRWSTRAVPILGGVGIFIAFWASLLISSVYLKGTIKSTGYLLASCALMFLLGLFDDIKKIKPPTKLIWQMIAATIVIFIGNMRIDFFPWPIANILLTYLWLVGITNAVNLLDNMDGLAGGIAVIASVILGIFFWFGGQNQFLSITISCAGATLGFLFYNFPPAKIFMANSGSMFLGFLLAALALGRQSQASNVFATLGIPTLIMLLPILDTTFVMITRLLRGQSPIQGGTDHTSHRLIAYGFSERRTVIILYCVAIISGSAAAGLEILDYYSSLAIIPLLLIPFALLTSYLGKVKVITSQEASHDCVKRIVGVLTYQVKLFEILLDLFLIGFSYYLAYWTISSLDMTIDSMSLLLKSWPIALVSAYIWLYVFGVYRSFWYFLGINDLLRYIGAVFFASCTAWLGSLYIYPLSGFSVNIFIVYGLFLFIGITGSRLSFQILDRFLQRNISKNGRHGVLIYGADESGELVLTWILRNPHLGYRPVAFIDDRSHTWGKYIHGVKVIGDQHRCIRLIDGKQIEGIIFSSLTQLTSSEGEGLFQMCKERGLWVRLLQIDFVDVHSSN